MLQGSQFITLKNDILSNSGLTPFRTAGNDQAIADYYNTSTSGMISTNVYANRYDVLMWAASGTVLSNIYNATLGVVSGNVSVHSAALGFYKLLQTDGTLLVGEAGLSRLAVTLMNNKVVTLNDLLALQKTVQKVGSTSGEALFGVGTSIVNQDISFALRGY